MTKLKLHWQILIAIGLATLAGIFLGQGKSIFGVQFYDIYDFLGSLFLNALKMIVIPLIMSSIICGVSGISDNKDLGRLGAKTFFFYFFTGTLAVLLGLLFINIFQPGIVHGQPAGVLLGLHNFPDTMSKQFSSHGIHDVTQVFLNTIPPNIFDAAVTGNLLGLIFFSILFGHFMTKIAEKNRDVLLNLWKGVFDTMLKITFLVMKFAPIGVFGLVAKALATTGFHAFLPIFTFFMTVLCALLVHALVVLPALMYITGRINPIKHYKSVLPALLTAFSTASSAATLPLTIECVEKKMGVSNKISSFVLPLGTSFNLNGTALYECAAALFIAQAYGIHMSFTTQFIVVFTALITSVGVAGIPAASLVAISIILGIIGLPLEGIGIIMVTDRFLDMVRTTVNIYGDTCVAAIIAKSEGETLFADVDKEELEPA